MYSAPNLDAAKKFLEASGYSATNPVKITLMYPPEHYGASTAAWMQVIKKELEATGEMQVTLTAQEWSTYVPALTGGQSYEAGVLGCSSTILILPTIWILSSTIVAKVQMLLCRHR